jgi:hypothetical protein
MWLTSRSNPFMKGPLLHTQALCGLMATGAIAAADTYTTADTGRGQEAAALTYAVRGNIHPAVTDGIEVVGGKPPCPLKGE